MKSNSKALLYFLVGAPCLFLVLLRNTSERGCSSWPLNSAGVSIGRILLCTRSFLGASLCQ